MSENTFSIDLRILRGIAHLASKDASRHVLTGIFVQIRKDDLRVSATNGRCLACYRVPEQHDFERSVILPIYWLGFLKLGKIPAVTFTCNENTFEVEHGDRIFKGKIIEGNYPDWVKVIPETEMVKVSSLNFDIELAIDFVNCLKAINPRKNPTVVIRQHKDKLGPISILSPDDSNFYGVQMPCRSNTDKIPEWVTK